MFLLLINICIQQNFLNISLGRIFAYSYDGCDFRGKKIVVRNQHSYKAQQMDDFDFFKFNPPL